MMSNIREKYLDEQVAEEIFGWRVGTIPTGYTGKALQLLAEVDGDPIWALYDYRDDQYAVITECAFTTEMADAWKIVEVMERDGYFFQMSKTSKVWSVCFGKLDEDEVWERGNSAPECICHAALRAKKLLQ